MRTRRPTSLVVALLVAAGCAATAEPPSRQSSPAASAEEPSRAAAEPPAPEVAQQRDGTEGQGPLGQGSEDARATAEAEATPGAPPEPAPPAPTLGGAVIEAKTFVGEGSEWTTRVAADGTFEITGSGGRGDGSTALSKEGGCLVAGRGAIWLGEAAEIVRGATRLEPPAEHPMWGGKSLARVILLDEDGTRWEPAEEALKRRLSDHAQRLFEMIEAQQSPPAGPPTSKGWRLLTISVESPSGSARFMGVLSSSGLWHCESVKQTGRRDPYERREARLGFMSTVEAAAALDSILSRMRPASAHEEGREGQVQLLVEVEREGTPAGVTATRATAPVVLKAWGRKMGSRARVCAETSVGRR